jgi:class 3 adenylate cyclase
VNADALVASLDRVFSRFDEISTRLGLEKLKTIGDAYMCAAGVTTRQPDHLLRCVLAGMEMLRVIEEEGVAGADGAPWRMRVGIHPGPVVAGVIGQKRFAFDLWGDTVNTGSRRLSTSRPRSTGWSRRSSRAWTAGSCRCAARARCR